MGKIEDLYKNPKKKKPSKKEGEADTTLLATARERARKGATYWKDNWEKAEDDLHFLYVDQWPSEVRTERNIEKRPCLTNNVLPSFVDQITGEQKQQQPSIKIKSEKAATVTHESGESEELKISSLDGEKTYSMADVLSGLIRNIEYGSNAGTSYDIAGQAAVESGFSYLRVLSDFKEEEGFDQELKIKHIENQFSVTMDPNAKERDRSDANWCFIDDLMEKEVFEKEYPDASPDAITSGMDDSATWFPEGMVKVSEYFTREPITQEVALLSDGRTVSFKDLEPIVDELMEKGVTIVRTRKVKTYKVMWRKITGLNVLEGPIETPYTTIPVVPIWGKTVAIKNKIHYMSAIRHSKDAARMSNYFDSAATESVALAPKAPFIGAEGHIEGRETEWGSANTKNLSILTYIAQYQGDPGPRREQPAAVPSAELAMSAQMTDKIKATMGLFDASLGARGNATSGKQEMLQQKQGDRGSFAFTNNRDKAIVRIGQLLIEAIPKTYDTERVERIMMIDGTEDYVKLNEQVFDDEAEGEEEGKKGAWVTINDLSVGKFGVVVTSGPAYATQRIEATDAMLAFAQAVPASAAMIGDLIAMNQDWPGAEAFAKRLKKTIPPNLLSKEERKDIEEDMPEEQEPSPEQLLQGKELEVRGLEAEAKIKSADATIKQAEADTAQAGADMLKAQLETDDAVKALKMLDDLASGGNEQAQQVKEMVAEFIAEIMNGANQQ